jgi:hypothetical protein
MSVPEAVAADFFSMLKTYRLKTTRSLKMRLNMEGESVVCTMRKSGIPFYGVIQLPRERKYVWDMFFPLSPHISVSIIPIWREGRIRFMYTTGQH